MSILLGWSLILLLALPIGVFTVWHVAGKFAASSWPTTRAEIVRSAPYQTSKPALWCLKLGYRYQVGGRILESKRVSSSFFAGTGCDRDRQVIAARLERMQPGARITVRVDPRDPGSAVVYLAPALEVIDGFGSLFALTWLLGGISAVRAGRKERREQDAARAATHQPAFR